MVKMRTWITSKITKRMSWKVLAMEIQILGKEPRAWLEIMDKTIVITLNIWTTIQIIKIQNKWTNPLPWIKPLRPF